MTRPLDEAALALTRECAEGDPRAIEIFEERCLGASLERALARLGADAVEVDEVKQCVRLKLLVAEPERRPRITEYTGRGALEAWVRVIAMREMLSLRRSRAREIPQDEAMLALMLPAVDPELQDTKQRYAREFRSAFEDAWHQLEGRERTVLRYSALDDLSIDDLGRLYGVHRATAARWLVKARNTLLERTRAYLMERLDVSPEELDGILRLIQSQLDASLGSLE